MTVQDGRSGLLRRPRAAGSRRTASFFGSPRKALILVLLRGDGAIAILRDRDRADKNLSSFLDLRTQVYFAFRSGEAADAVLAGANFRLSKADRDRDGWRAGLSAGEAAAAIKAEAKDLSYSFEIVHPHSSEAPAIGYSRRKIARRAVALLLYGIVLSAAALIGLVAGMRLAGF